MIVMVMGENHRDRNVGVLKVSTALFRVSLCRVEIVHRSAG